MIVITFLWKKCYFCQFWGVDNDENASKRRFKAKKWVKNGSKMSKIFIFFGRNDRNPSKIGQNSWLLIRYNYAMQKNEIPAEKIKFKAVSGQKWAKLRKNRGNSPLWAHFTEKWGHFSKIRIHTSLKQHRP